MIKIAFRRYAKGLVALVGVVIIYAAVGFGVVPSILQKQIPAWGVAHLDRHVSVQAIAFNPFTLRLQAEGLVLAEKERNLAAAPLGADLGIQKARPR